MQSVPPPKTEFCAITWPEGPVDLEIGAGQGLHPIQYCKSNPGRTLIAVERTRNRFKNLDSRRNGHPDLHNLIIARADAMAFVAHFVPDQALDRVFLLYPNPYPKSAQANLRWHRSPFMQFLKQKMKPMATLHLATNLQWFAAEAVCYMNRDHHFRTVVQRKLDASHPARTHFELKYLARGETCFDLVFEKELQ